MAKAYIFFEDVETSSGVNITRTELKLDPGFSIEQPFDREPSQAQKLAIRAYMALEMITQMELQNENTH